MKRKLRVIKRLCPQIIVFIFTILDLLLPADINWERWNHSYHPISFKITRDNIVDVMHEFEINQKFYSCYGINRRLYSPLILSLSTPYYFYKAVVLNGEYHLPRYFTGDGCYRYAYQDLRQIVPRRFTTTWVIRKIVATAGGC